MQTQTHTEYDGFMKKRQLLGKLTQQLGELTTSLAMTEDQSLLTQLEERLQADNFKILVMGEFNRGKSTLINALLGEKVLPAYAIPTTAIINEVKWSENGKKALLHWRQTNGALKPPQEIAVHEIERYVTLQEGEDHQQLISESPYAKVELFWNLEICKHGVELVDSPGLNAYTVHDEVAMGYLSSADAVLFVIAADFPVSAKELSVVEHHIRGMGFEDIFFVCNRINMVDEEERDRVKARCMALLAPYTRAGEKHLFFVDAKGALTGQLKQDALRLQQSGITTLEKMLETFLIKERGRVKLATPARQLKLVIRKVRTDIIPTRQQLLNADLATIEARYAKAQKELTALEQRRSLIIRQVESFRLDVKLTVSEMARQFYREVADKIPAWTQAHTLTNGMSWRDAFSFKEAVKRIVGEVTEHLSERVKTEAGQWQKEKLTPLLTTRLAQLQANLEPSLQEFVKRVDELYIEVASGSHLAVDVQEREIPAWERVLAGAAGLLIDIGAAGMGATFGFKGLLASIIPQLVVLTVGYLLVGLNPILLIPVIITAIINGGIRLYKTSEAVKHKVGEEYKSKLREARDELAGKIAAGVDQKLNQIQQALDTGLEREIQSIRTQVESVIKLKQQGQAQIQQAQRDLTHASQMLNAIDQELDELMAQVVLM